MNNFSSLKRLLKRLWNDLAWPGSGGSQLFWPASPGGSGYEGFCRFCR